MISLFYWELPYGASEEKPTICARQTKDEKRKLLSDLSQKLREERVFQGLGVVNTVSCHEKAKEDKD